jgi:hypothetical protein
MSELPKQSESSLPIRIEPSILESAKQNGQEAIKTMFSQFIPVDEQIMAVDYLGVQGLWWVGRHSFACVSERRIAAIMVGPWGEVIYQDGLLEHYNSGVIYQPGLLGLYIICAVYVLVSLSLFGLPLILFPYVVQYYYRVNKCGLVWVIRDGVSVYLFTNRKSLTKANRLYRLVADLHDKRVTHLREH